MWQNVGKSASTPSNCWIDTHTEQVGNLTKRVKLSDLFPLLVLWREELQSLRCMKAMETLSYYAVPKVEMLDGSSHEPLRAHAPPISMTGQTRQCPAVLPRRTCAAHDASVTILREPLPLYRADCVLLKSFSRSISKLQFSSRYR